VGNRPFRIADMNGIEFDTTLDEVADVNERLMRRLIEG